MKPDTVNLISAMCHLDLVLCIKTSRFHHDRALDGRFFRKRGEPIDDVCCIHYLSVVDENTPSFCVVPRSNKFRSLKEAYNGLGSEYIEIPIYGSVGTCILYDISIYHTKLDGKDPKGRRRRTVHQYFARGGWIGIRPPTPTLTNWTLIPKRLCMSKDPIKRKFFLIGIQHNVNGLHLIFQLKYAL